MKKTESLLVIASALGLISNNAIAASSTDKFENFETNTISKNSFESNLRKLAANIEETLNRPTNN